MNGKVVVAYLHPEQVAAVFHHSLLDLWRHDLLHKRRILEGGGALGNYCGTGRLVQGRNEVTAAFLDKLSAEWLWMVDADMGFDGDVVDRLVDSAHRNLRPVMAGLYFGQKYEGTGPHNSRRFSQIPMIYQWYEADDGSEVCGFGPILEYPRDQVVPVGGAGAGCLLVHRTALVKIRDRWGDTWFDQAPYKGRLFGEDLSFCLKLQSVDVPIHVDTSIRCCHSKTTYLVEEPVLCMTP